jgi:glycosyltransferase involved in cell wall biosynthesis
LRIVAGVLRGQEDHVRALNDRGIPVRPVLLGERRAFAEGPRLARALWRREPYVLFHRHNHASMRAAIQDELRARPPALCYFDHLDSCLFAQDIAPVPFVADFHNIYSLIVRREAQDPKRPWMARQYLTREAALLDRTERDVTRRARAVLSVSEVERAHFAAMRGAPVYLVLNGVDCAKYAALPTGREAIEPNILFVGSLAWPPNAAAVRFLAEVALPQLRSRWPRVRLTIVGRDPGRDLRRLADGASVVLAENVPDMLPYLHDATLLAVPLDSGGGTRLKILEAFAAGLPVVSTPVGCEGIAASNGRELVVADAAGFVDAVAGLLADPGAGREMAGHARTLAREHYDWPAIGRTAVNALLPLVEPATAMQETRAVS